MLSDTQLLRYSRQIMLPQIDIIGQQALLAASVFIVGMGGLGCPAALYLAAAGVGRLVLNDMDKVDLSNLQRQIAYRETDLGQAKADAVKQAVQQLDSSIDVIALSHQLDEAQMAHAISQVDLVLDCTDNFSTRHLINRFCVHANKPLVSAAAVGFEAQLSVFDRRNPVSPCYHCLYPDLGNENLSCAENGVIGPLVGVIGAMQALEAVKIITGIGRNLVGRLLVFDALRMEWRELGLPRDPACQVCSRCVVEGG